MRSWRIAWLPVIWFGFLLLHDAVAFAVDGPELTRIFPAGGQRGTEVEVTASGKFPTWPLSLWCDCDALTWGCLEASGKFSVSISDDAPLGVHWLRLHDANGATSIKPFVVGAIAEAIETEPNDRLVEGSLLENLPLLVNGALEKSGDVDSVRLKLKAGETLVASVDSARFLGSPVDACLQLVDAKGFVIEQNLDFHNLDPQLVYTATADGEFAIRVFGFPSAPNGTIGFGGEAGFLYRLTLTTGPWLESCEPLAVSSSKPTTLTWRGFSIDSVPGIEISAQPVVTDKEQEAFSLSDDLTRGLVLLPIKPYEVLVFDRSLGEQPQPMTLPACVTGCVREPKEQHAFQFSATKDSAWRFSIDSRKLGSQLDAELRLVDIDGKVLAAVDDAGNAADPVLDWRCPVDGTYRIFVRDLFEAGSDQHFYRLNMEPQVPEATLTLADDLIVGKVGQEIEVLVKIQRIFGCGEEITVQCESVLGDVSCEPVVSKGEGDSAKQVKLKLIANKPVQRSLRITSSMKSQVIRTAKTASGQANIWLSIASP